MIATFVKQLEEWIADARVYNLDPPHIHDNLDELEQIETVVVSVSRVPLETMVFLVDAVGDVNFSEILQLRGIVSHEQALQELGYMVPNGYGRQ